MERFIYENVPCGHCKGTGFLKRAILNHDYLGRMWTPQIFFAPLRKEWIEFVKRNSLENAGPNELRKMFGRKTGGWWMLRRPFQGELRVTSAMALGFCSLLIAEKNGWTPQIEKEFEKTHPWMKEEFKKQS